jgi:phosphatidylinositol-3-phosphatase
MGQRPAVDLRNFSLRKNHFILSLVALVFLSFFVIIPAASGESIAGTISTPVANTRSVQHVIVILMENEEYSQVINNSNAPYENKLANTYALAENYDAVSHPSLPNYLALTAGSTFGVTSDCEPAQCPQNVTNMVDLIKAKGLSWKAYEESMPVNCSQSISNDGLYYPKHDPFVYYDDITGNNGQGKTSAYCNAHVIPFGTLANKTGQFFTDVANNRLPSYSFITPNMCDDAHNCALSVGDKWLSRVVPLIIKSPGFASTVIFIVYDEGITNIGGGGHVACIVVGPSTLVNHIKSDKSYNHYSLLATVEAVYNLGNLGRNDATAKVMKAIIPSA